MANKDNVYLASRPRYEILDGLRGVAAILVVAYHLFEIHYHGGPDQPINHGYLAVDFFFVLSGFVIGYAYDDRWRKPHPLTPSPKGEGEAYGSSLTLWTFFKRRLIRLHPMAIFGSLFGALTFYFGSCEAFPLINETPWWMVVLVMLWCFTMIPLPHSMDIRGWAETNPLDGPAWSLQWEYLANILYALLFRRFSRLALSICVAVFAVLTLTLCLDVDVTGFLHERSYASYTVVGGWSTTPDQLQVGLTRLLYPFFGGLLVSRLMNGGSKSLNSLPPAPDQREELSTLNLKHGFWWCSLMIMILFCMPWMGLGTEEESRWTNGLYEAFCILICFPLIVAIGAGSSVRGGKSEAINRFLGDISYPLYITHFPLIYMMMSWTDSHKDAPLATHIFASVCVFILAILVAYGAYRLYDLPVRECLKKKLFK